MQTINELFDELNDTARLQKEAAAFARFDEEKALARFLEKNVQMDPADIKPKVRTIGRWKWAAAAAILLLVAVGSYRWLSEKPQPVTVVRSVEQKDVEPGKKEPH